MKRKIKRSPLEAATKKKNSLPWYSKPILGFRNELITINKQLCIISAQITKLAGHHDELIDQNDEIIDLSHCILAQLIQLNGRHA